jgi:hypothetical protein
MYIGYRAAQLCAIFCPKKLTKCNDNVRLQHIFVYVRWFGEASSPHRAHKMRIVKKISNSRGEWLGGVIPLMQIERLISLHPVIGPALDPSEVNGVNSIEKFDSFYINPFYSHTTYTIFA